MKADELIAHLQAATERAFLHRKITRRLVIKVGFWPDGLCLRATIPARTQEELERIPPPVVIPWAEIASVAPKLPTMLDDMVAKLEGPRESRP